METEKKSSGPKAPRATRNSEMDALLAEEVPTGPTPSGPARRGETPDTAEKVQMGVVIVCCLFIAFQISTSLRGGALSTNEVAEQTLRQNQIESCVAKFWEVANLLQAGQLPGEAQNCTDTNMPLIVTQVGDDVIVRHPQPQQLGFSEIVVSKSNPVPELIR